MDALKISEQWSWLFATPAIQTIRSSKRCELSVFIHPAGIGVLDASDIKSLEEAKEEIRRLRQVAKEAFRKNDDLEKRLSTMPRVDSAVTTTSSRMKKEGRAAVLARGSDRNYVKTTVPKSEQVRNLIYHSIKRNMLFRACSEEEL